MQHKKGKQAISGMLLHQQIKILSNTNKNPSEKFIFLFH